MKKYFVALLILFVILIAACTSKYPQDEIDKFAQCLTEKGVVMYGAFWCPHCARVKKNFGSSFKYLKYVECDPKCDPKEGKPLPSFCRGYEGQSDLCLEKGIENYATFEFQDGSKLVGEPTFEELAEKSGCSLPGKN